MSEDPKTNAPATQQTKSKSPGPRNRNRNRDRKNRSKSPNPAGQGKGPVKSKSPGPGRKQGGKGKPKSPARPDKVLAPEAEPKSFKIPPPHPFMLVDSLLVPLASDYVTNFGASVQAVLTAGITANADLKSSSIPFTKKISTGLERHLTAAFWCDPALNSIVAEAKTTEFIPTEGLQSDGHQEPAVIKNDDGPQKATASDGKKNGRSRSPGPSKKKKGKSKSPRRKAKSPVRPQKGKPQPSPAQKTETKTKGKKNEGVKKNTAKNLLPLHVQFDPFMVGVVTETMGIVSKKSTSTIGMGGRVKLLSFQGKVAKYSTPVTELSTQFVQPPSYLEVEPLISQMVPEDIAEAINLELSKKSEDFEEKMDDVDVYMTTPMKLEKNDSDNVEPLDLYQTPPKDFKGRVAFFEKLTKQKTERPTVDPTKKVKAAVSEKVRSAHDQVRTSLVSSNATKNGNKATNVDLPKDLTPLAEKRDRVDKFFDKGEGPAAQITLSKPRQASNWATVETKLPVTFEAGDLQDALQQQDTSLEKVSSKVDKLVAETEKDLVVKSDANGASAAKNGSRSKSPKRNKVRSRSPKRKQGKSKSPVRSKNAHSEKAEIDSAQISAEKKVPKTVPDETTACKPPAIPAVAEDNMEAAQPVKAVEKESEEEPSSIDEEAKSPIDTADEPDLVDETAPEAGENEHDRGYEPAEARKSTPVTLAGGEKSSERKVSLQAPSSPLSVVQPATEHVEKSADADTAASKAEAHVNKLLQNAEAEVLRGSKEIANKIENSSTEEFPSLAGEPSSKSKQMSSSEQSKISYAKVLSEGKKQDKARDDTPGARFLIPELSLAGINIKEIEHDLKKGLATKKGVENASRHEKENNGTGTGIVKKEEMAQKRKQASGSSSVEETKEDFSADPGFMPIKREIRKKKGPTENEAEPVQLVESVAEPIDDNENVVVTTKAFKKNNFNQFSALADLGDIPAEIVAEAGSKKAKVRGLKTPLQASSPNRKKVRFGGTASKESKSKPVPIESWDIPAEERSSPPLVALPLHILNNLANTKPLSYVFDAVFWVFALLIGAPLGAIGIALLTVYRLIMFVPRSIGVGKIQPKKDPSRKLAVVITGCDSGFGKDLAISLLEEGFFVFCCCLRKESLKAYETKEHAMPILMDVTEDSDVDRATKQVFDWLSKEDGRYLHALVNNAGIGSPSLVDWATVADFQKMADVNFMGMVRCTKKFLPRFKSQATGATYTSARIVNMVSMAGLVSGGLFGAGYEASKHAAEVFTANLRQEMKAFGLKVTVINPSFHRTALTKDMTADLRRKWKSLPAAKRKEYGGEEYIKMVSTSSKVASEVVNWDSRHVVNGMHQSVTATSPPARILVGGDAKYFLVLVRMLPTWISSRLQSITSLRLGRLVAKNKVD